MSALSREELTEACRVLFSLAGENLILPPLIREAGDALATSGYTYYCAVGARCVRVDVEFDQAYVNENKFPLQRLPLQIACFLCNLDYEVLPAQFDESERLALIGSFFLGARAPITVEANEAERDYKLSVQLSPTFFAEWREPLEEGEAITAESLCRRVGASLYEKSRDFFGGRESGVAIWSLRAAQDLLGAPKLTPEALWPFIGFGFTGFAAASEAPPAKEPEIAAPPPVAVCASLSAPVAGAMQLPVVQERRAQPSAEAFPTREPVEAKPLEAKPAPPLVAPPAARRNWRGPAGIAVAAALAASLAAWLQPAALPTLSTARDNAPMAAAPVAANAADAANEARGVDSALPPAPSGDADAPPTAMAAAPPSAAPIADPAFAPQASTESWPLAPGAPRAKDGAHAKAAAAKKIPTPAPAAATGRPSTPQRVARKARNGGPMQGVGRAMDHMASALFNGLQAIPHKIVKLTTESSNAGK